MSLNSVWRNIWRTIQPQQSHWQTVTMSHWIKLKLLRSWLVIWLVRIEWPEDSEIIFNHGCCCQRYRIKVHCHSQVHIHSPCPLLLISYWLVLNQNWISLPHSLLWNLTSGDHLGEISTSQWSPLYSLSFSWNGRLKMLVSMEIIHNILENPCNI